jgi:hypothetical protein
MVTALGWQLFSTKWNVSVEIVGLESAGGSVDAVGVDIGAGNRRSKTAHGCLEVELVEDWENAGLGLGELKMVEVFVRRHRRMKNCAVPGGIPKTAERDGTGFYGGGSKCIRLDSWKDA